MEPRPAGLRGKALADLAKLRDRLPQGASPREPAQAPSAPIEPAGFAPKVVVRRERKGRGGKTVTCVAGVAAAARPELARRLARALGCGGGVQGEELVLQGDQVERAARWLREQGAPRVVEGN